MACQVIGVAITKSSSQSNGKYVGKMEKAHTSKEASKGVSGAQAKIPPDYWEKLVEG